MQGAAYEEAQAHVAFVPLSRAAADTQFNGVAAAASANKGIDMQGFDEALIVVTEGAIAAGASIAYTAQGADTNTNVGSVATDIVDGAAVAASASFADTDDNKCKLIRVRAQDCKRFLFVKRVQTGAFAAVDSVHVFLLKNRSGRPVTQASSIDAAVSVAYKHDN